MNAKQRKFIAEYLKDQNATRAAIRAGYSKKTAGSQAHDLLKKPEIKAAVEEKIGKVEEKAVVDTAYWLSSVKDVLERCKQAVPVMEFDHETKQMAPTGQYEFDSAGANAALRMIGQFLGVLSEKHVVDVGKTLEELILSSMEKR